MESSLQQQHRGSKRAQLLQKAVQMQRKDPFCLTADKLKAKWQKTLVSCAQSA